MNIRETIQTVFRGGGRGRLGVLLLAAALLVTMIAGCGSESAGGDTITPGSPGEPAGTAISEDYVRQVAENRSSNPVVVREAVVKGEGEDQEILIGIDRPGSLQDGSVVGVMGAYSQHVFNTLYENPRVASVTITMYGVEQGGHDDEVAIRLRIDREDLENVDWSMFGPMMLSDMVTEYYVAPEIEESTFS